MESLLCLSLLVLLLLIYFSNRHNAVNQWCSLAGFFFWLGLAKEAIAYNFIPFIENALSIGGLAAYFVPAYAVMTWALYSLAVPTAILFACAMGGALPRPFVRWLLYLPAAVLSCMYLPWRFHLYQQQSTAFWVTFACYNLLGCAVFAFAMIRAVLREPDRAARTQKKLVAGVLLPPVLFWALSVFLTHPFHLTHLNKLWQLNILVLLGCVAFYVSVAFRGGMMGLRLTSESYRWNSDMGLIRRGASYTKHMIKNQTAKMAWCVENLTAPYSAQNEAPPEELAILTRAIDALQNYTERAAQYADAIVLSEAVHPLDELLSDAFALCGRPAEANVSSLCLQGTSDISLCCDRTHMTEVFLNLFTNALEAMSAPAVIEVQVASGHGMCAIHIIDHGRGMSARDTARLFEPYYTTKDSPHNMGLGLAYCKNVIRKHGGEIHVRSKEGLGTTMIIRLPASRFLTQSAQSKGAAHHA